eukprot:2183327-Rhodomonas_salina.4
MADVSAGCRTANQNVGGGWLRVCANHQLHALLGARRNMFATLGCAASKVCAQNNPSREQDLDIKARANVECSGWFTIQRC